MSLRDYDDKTPKIRLGMSTSTGTLLHGCQQPQHRYISLEVEMPGKALMRIAMSLEQFTHLITSNMATTCTLERYFDEGPIKKDVVPEPVSVRKRMNERLQNARKGTLDRLMDVRKDIHEMMNGRRAGKKSLEEILRNVDVAMENFVSNENFTVNQANEELSSMLDNTRSQLAGFITKEAGADDFNPKLLEALIPDDVQALPAPENLASEPLIDDYETKVRTEVTIDDMTSMEVSEALYVELKRLEALEPTPEAKSRGGMNTKSLYCPNVVEHPRNRIRIRYISYQADSILELDEARDYLKFLRNLETFEGFHGHFHYKKYL